MNAKDPSFELSTAYSQQYCPTQEIRFAVVMFGGVSLAIYMNGITQELMNMVRATAPEKPPKKDGTSQKPLLEPSKLRSSEKVYRKIGQLLTHGENPKSLDQVRDNSQILTRFVVDILSGTSAGGINSVFLAKALANQQETSLLQSLWKEEGDIDLLLNDKKSYEKTFPSSDKKRSLLNSKRMYYKLFDAFEAMDRQAERDENFRSPLVDELDLFVTATDLHGVWAPIKTSDRLIPERVHKMVFQFQYPAAQVYPVEAGARSHDFLRPFNKMLAFAARCTSSFPVAFEPMRLKDIQDLFGMDESEFSSRNWRKFFQRYLRIGEGYQNYWLRQLADGGYLQNKPFSHAIQALSFRENWCPVDRKLLFLDPSPEDSSKSANPYVEVNFVENLVKAASSLPRYQTIREDLEAINRRNRQLDRARTLREKITSGEMAPTWDPIEDREIFINTEIQTLVKVRGAAFVSYLYLRIYDVTDYLALLVARILGFPDDSDQFRAIRHIVKAWRESNYSADRQVSNRESPKSLLTEFLFSFDIPYRQRRLRFLSLMVDEKLKNLRSRLSGSDDQFLRHNHSEIQNLKTIRRGARDAFRCLKEFHDELWVPWEFTESGIPSGNSGRQRRLREILLTLKIDERVLEEIMSWPTEELCYAFAMKFFKQVPQDQFRQFASELDGYISHVCKKSGKMMNDVVRLDEDNPSTDYLRLFDYYDSILYPTLSCINAGENDYVQTYRIGPEDAGYTRVLNDPSGESKLAGKALGNFGAFLRREWRDNDIMWGRLDGAERIIQSLIPGEHPEVREDRKKLIHEAHEIIINEEFGPQQKDEFFRIVLEFLETKSSRPENSKDSKIAMSQSNFVSKLRDLMETEENGFIKALLLNALNSDQKYDLFKRSYKVPGPPHVEMTLDRAKRSAKIFGEMLRNLQPQGGPVDRLGAAIGRIGPIMGYFIELCLPDTKLGKFRNLTLGTLILASILVLIGSYTYFNEAIPVGWWWLALSAVFYAIALLLEWFILPQQVPGFWRWLHLLAIFLLGFGLVYFGWMKTIPQAFWPGVVTLISSLTIGISWLKWSKKGKEK